MSNLSQMFNFDGCTALVLGASSGIGKSLAEGLIANGADLFIASIDKENLDKTKSEFEAKYNKTLHTTVVDVTRADEIEALVAKVKDIFGSELNIMINSVGTTKRTPAVDISLEEWEAIQRLNSTAAFLLAQKFYPLLKAANFGRVVNISSYFASHGSANRLSYAASKGAVLQQTRVLAAEWAKDDITVNSISPGGFLTPLTESLLDDPDTLAKIESSIPMGRLGHTEELVSAALFLTSPASSYVTGIDVTVDGGWHVL